MMVTSYPNRTSPVLRGKWVLDSLLGTPPPQPPPNVPALKDTGAGGKPASVRARLEEHRKNPVCAACHSSMDPLGFALENFDATGKWRTIDAGTPVDASGVLPNGTQFSGPDRPARRIAGPQGAVRAGHDPETAGLCAWPSDRGLRYAHRAQSGA